MAFNDRQSIYCEGYASKESMRFAIHHAWCIDKEGKVYDPTPSWNDGEIYFGIPISLQFANNIVLESGYYCIIDSWRIGWPTLKVDPSEYIHELWKK